MNYTRLRSKRHGGHTALTVSVGATWVASKLGGLNVRECLQPRNKAPCGIRCTGNCWEAAPVIAGGRPKSFGKKRARAPDEERNKARQDCADLILKLWSHRASLSMNRRPLQSFDSILAAIDRLRGSESIYFRDFRKADDKKSSNDIEKWLNIAIRVDAIARDLVRACADIAISGASKEEEEWLKTGLNLSTHKCATKLHKRRG